MSVVTADRLGAVLFPGCRSVADVEERIKLEENATARTVWTCVTRLMAELKTGDVMDIYKRSGEVIAWLRGADSPPSPASKLTFCNAVLSLTRPAVSFRVPASATKAFIREAAILGRAVRKDKSSNRLDIRERAAILPWPVIVSAYMDKRAVLGDQEAVIAALYLGGGSNPAGAPRRLDYNAIRVFFSSPKRVESGLNYVVVRSPSVTELVLQEFKTARHYGIYTVKLPAAVSRVVHASVSRMPREWLIHDTDGNPVTPSRFGRMVAATMRKITGKGIGVSNLRKSYITWVCSRTDSVDRLRLYATAMNHSPSEQKSYIRKNISSTIKGDSRYTEIL